MKKLVAALLTATLIFSSVGSFVFNDHSTTAEAKSYKSGKRSFNTNKNNTINNSNIQKKKQDTETSTNKTTSNKGGFTSGGLMRGLFVGGIAGLLFGSMFGSMGALGSLLGFAINAAAIIFIFIIIRKIFNIFDNKKKKEEANSWRS